jgi:predicted RNA binding protein YcfA (HicA-like mRNA interferase family)
MKREDLLRHLLQHGCALLREGGRHSIFVHRAAGKSSAVPRHREINEILARKI